MMKLIGLTGGIGTGKSTVSDYLIQKGYRVLDADKVAKEIVSPNSEIFIQLKDTFGKEIVYEDGTLNRKKLADIIFSNPEKKAILDKLMHKKIIEVLLKKAISFSGEKVVFIDAPLLYESNLDLYLDKVWVVDADDEIRIQRVIQRDQLTREEIIKRIQNQMSRKEKLRRADCIINNSTNKVDLYKQIDKLLNEL
ncbi:MAG: dephospho-CoA kinase [Anaerovoracaceae bacterium]